MSARKDPAVRGPDPRQDGRRSAASLRFPPNRSARLLEQVLRSALGNAEDKGVRDIEELNRHRGPRGRRPMMKRSCPRPWHRYPDQRRKRAHYCRACRREPETERRGQVATGRRPQAGVNRPSLVCAYGPRSSRGSLRSRTLWSENPADGVPHRDHGVLVQPVVREQARLFRTAGRRHQDPPVHQEETPRLWHRQDSDRTHAGKGGRVHPTRPASGSIIGKKGEKIDQALRRSWRNLHHRHIEIKTLEVNRPETEPQLVAQDIAEQLEKRVSSAATDQERDPEGDGERGQGDPGAAVGPARRCGNGPVRKGHAGQHPRCPRSGPRWNTGFHEAATAQGNIGIKSLGETTADYLKPEEPSDASDAQTGKISKKQRGKNRR